jgi:maleate isomerase
MLVSCTAIRAVEVVDAAEELLEKPIITSNSAMLWYAARRLGITAAITGIGRLGQFAWRNSDCHV